MLSLAESPKETIEHVGHPKKLSTYLRYQAPPPTIFFCQFIYNPDLPHGELFEHGKVRV